MEAVSTKRLTAEGATVTTVVTCVPQEAVLETAESLTYSASPDASSPPRSSSPGDFDAAEAPAAAEAAVAEAPAAAASNRSSSSTVSVTSETSEAPAVPPARSTDVAVAAVAPKEPLLSTRRPSWMGYKLFDWDSEALVAYDDELMFEFMEAFTEEMRTHIKTLNDRIEQKADSEEWKAWAPWKVAHSVKGVASSLGFARLAAYSKSVEASKDEIDVAQTAEAAELIGQIFTDGLAVYRAGRPTEAE